ncbi:MAG: hypothetical protein PUA94_07065 [Bacteroidales bacterium]|nr:hypothetical protein [Bacteroidales bacterium]
MNGYNWNAAAFFERLTNNNKLANAENFRFQSVSSLEGFHTLISQTLSLKACVAVSDTSEGGTEMNNTPHTRRVKTVFLFMRHAADRQDLRQKCLDTMNELFRQFLSVLIQERTRLSEGGIYMDPYIKFHEIDKYFYSGGACAFFQIAIDTFTDLSYNPDEWTQ